MSDFPSQLGRPPRATLTTWGPHSAFGEYQAMTHSAGAMAQWIAANRAIYVPVTVQEPMTIYQMALFNGAVAGEVDVGIYSYPGTGTAATRLASAGKTAMSGANVLQVFDIADQTLSPGVYFLAGVCSTITTATFWRFSLATVGVRACGVCQEGLGEAKLPETATLAASASAFVPAIVASGRALL